jgi:hypothetical protein
LPKHRLSKLVITVGRSKLFVIPSRCMVSESLENVLRASLSPQWGEGRGEG